MAGRGYSIAGISYDDPMILNQFKTRRNINFVLLSDKNSEAIDAFGIRNPEYAPDHFAHGVPYPIVAVFDTEGVLKAKLYEASYKDRPANDAILDAIAAAEDISINQ